jgi:hypothetical protein
MEEFTDQLNKIEQDFKWQTATASERDTLFGGAKPRDMNDKSQMSTEELGQHGMKIQQEDIQGTRRGVEMVEDMKNVSLSRPASSRTAFCRHRSLTRWHPCFGNPSSRRTDGAARSGETVQADRRHCAH